jgi:hypothetical protein
MLYYTTLLTSSTRRVLLERGTAGPGQVACAHGLPFVELRGQIDISGSTGLKVKEQYQ